MVEGGKTIKIESMEPIELDVGNLTMVVVRYNGEKLEPLHRLSHRRRLIFMLDDE